MRNVCDAELPSIRGGNDKINAQVSTACKGQPDSANVTITSTLTGNASTIVGGGKQTYTVTAEVNCGDFRKAQAPASGSSGG